MIRGATQPWRWCRISTTSSTPKRVKPTSIRCAGEIGPSSAPAVRVSTSARGARTTPSPDCNVTVAKSGAANAPAMTSPARSWTAASGPWRTGCSPPFSCACRVPRGALPESWGSMSAPAIAGAGGSGMPLSPMRSAARWTGRSKPMTSTIRPGHKGQVKQGGTKALGRQSRRRRKKREPGRGHYDQDRPAIIAWVSRQGGVVIHATRDFTVKTVQKAADLAVHTGSRLYTDAASSYRAVKGYVHAFVNHTQKEYARGDVHENRAECLFSLLKPYLRIFRGVSQGNLPGYVGFFQVLRNFRSQNAFEQTELILWAALDPAIASRARRGDFVRSLDHFDLLQTGQLREARLLSPPRLRTEREV